MGEARLVSIAIYQYHLIIALQVPYPLISLVTRLPQTLYGAAPLAFRTRTFETFNLTFGREAEAADVFDSIKELTVISEIPFPVISGELPLTMFFAGVSSAKVDQLYAFDYEPKPPFDATGGWNVYNPREEFARMGIGSRSKAWRYTDLNKDYAVRTVLRWKLLSQTS